MTKEVNKVQDAWYLNFCTLKHICNNKLFFSDLHLKSLKFIKVREEIISLDKISTILLSTCSEVTITLNNIVYRLRYDSNFILFG